MSRTSAGFEPHPDPDALIAWFGARFGMGAETFAGHRFWHRPGSPSIWLAARGCSPPPGARLETLGVRALNEPPPRGKPTSVLFQRLGATATRNVYVLGPAHAEGFLCGETLTVTPVDDGRGYCVVRTPERVLGCGCIRGDQLSCELPRSWWLVRAASG